MTWKLLISIIIIGAFIWQLIVVILTEATARETGEYMHSVYELLWLMFIVYLGDQWFEERKNES